jgi:hypothetical protein
MLATPAEAGPDSRPLGELGVYGGVTPGVVGDLRNGALQWTVGLHLAAGSAVRYHLDVGYARIDPLNGLDLQPLTLGFPIIIGRSRDFAFAIEPLINIVEMEAYFTDAASAFLFESGVGLQAVMNFGAGFLAISPINLQFRYAVVGAGAGAFVAGTGFGMNWPVRASAGVRF